MSLPREAFTDSVGSKCVAATMTSRKIVEKILALQQQIIRFVSHVWGGQTGVLGGKFV